MQWWCRGGTEVVVLEMCRGTEWVQRFRVPQRRCVGVVQSCWCRGGAGTEVVVHVQQRLCSSRVLVQRGCRGGQEIVQRWCRRWRGAERGGTEVVQRCCMGSTEAAEVLVQSWCGGSAEVVQRRWYSMCRVAAAEVVQR